MRKANNVIHTLFTTNNAAGSSVNADALPVVAVYRDGVDIDDNATVEKVDDTTGLYLAYYTPSAVDWSQYSTISFVASATVDGTSAQAVILEEPVVQNQGSFIW